MCLHCQSHLVHSDKFLGEFFIYYVFLIQIPTGKGALADSQTQICLLVMIAISYFCMKLLIIPSNNNKKDTNLCLATAQLQLDCSDSILNLLKGKCRLYKIHGEDKRYMSNIRYIYMFHYQGAFPWCHTDKDVGIRCQSSLFHKDQLELGMKTLLLL